MKKQVKRNVLIAIAIALVAGLTAFAAANSSVRSSTKHAMMMRTDGITKDDYIYLGDLERKGNYSGNTLRWRVLDADKDNNGKGNAIFVLSEHLVGDKDKKGRPEGIAYYGKWFNPLRKATLNNFWHHSDMPAWCNDFYKNVFEPAEQLAIRPITKKDPGGEELGLYKDRILGVDQTGHNTWKDVTYEFMVWPDEIREQRVFFPSYEELKNETGLVAEMEGQTGWQQYWIRCPGEIFPYYDLFNLTRAFVIVYTNSSQHKDYGKTHVPDFEYDDITHKWWARPVMNIEKSSVVFSAVTGARETKTGEMKKIGDTGTYYGPSWGLAIEDKSRSSFDAKATAIHRTADGNYVKVEVEGASIGADEYISALVVDDKDQICYYGRITNCEVGAPDEIYIPYVWENEDPQDKKLYVFSEHYTDEIHSSFVSPMQYINIFDDSIRDHTVSYDLNGHGSPQPDWEIVENNCCATRPDDPEEVGYSFLTWYTEPEPQNTWEFETDKVTKDMTLYAGWDPHGYKVYFDPNGGNGEMPMQDRVYDDDTALPNCGFTASDGKRFNGWNVKEDGTGAMYYPGDTTPLTADNGLTVTLYAIWSDHFTVAFDLNGHGDIKPENKTANAATGWKVEEPKGVTDKGYSLESWHREPGCLDESKWDFNDEVPWDMALYAKWTPHNYTIHFDSNGGEGEMADQPRQVDDGLELPKSKFTKKGSAIKYWNTQKDGKGLKIPRDFTGNLALQDGSEVTLYAQWGHLAVTFDAGEGKVDTDYMLVGDDGTLSELPEAEPPKGEDLSFSGWYTDKVSGEKISEETVFADDTRVYARYLPEGACVVSFNPNGGSFGDDSLRMRATDKNGRLEELEEAPLSPEEGDNVFGGWYTDPAGGARVSKDNIFTTDLTLYAHWIEKYERYEITLDGNGGAYEDGPVTTRMTDENGLLAWMDRPTIGPSEGSYSAGMYSKPDGGIQIKDNTTFIEDTTVYSHWSVIYKSHTVELDPQGGEVSPTSVVTNYGVVPEKPSHYGFLPYLPTPVYPGYEFTGWFTEPEGGIKINNNANPFVTEDLTLYAHWRKADYAVQFAKNGGAGNMQTVNRSLGDEGSLPKNIFKREGYEFVGWNTSADGKGRSYADEYTGDVTDKEELVTLYAQWSAHSYTLIYDSNGGEGDDLMPNESRFFGDGKSLSPNKFTNGDNKFAEWNTEEDGSGEAYEDGYTGDFLTDDGGKITLYAQWIHGYTVHFDANGGEGNMSDQVRGDENEKPLKANTFSLEGHHFDTWNTEKDGDGTSYPDGYTGKINVEGEEITLYAQWKPNEYIIQYDKNSGEGDMADQKRYYDDEEPLLDCGFTYDGLAFLNWNTRADGKGTSYPVGYTGNITSDSGTVTLYAQWRSPYTVKFDANLGSGSMEDQQRIYGDDKELPQNAFERNGYRFVEWNTEKDGSGDAYPDKAAGDLMTESGTITLYAQWGASKRYTITINANGGSFDGKESYTETTDENGKLDRWPQSPNIIPEGGAFSNYFTSPDGGAQFYPGMVFESDLTLYAHWTPIYREFHVTLDPQGGTVDPDHVRSVYARNIETGPWYFGQLETLPVPKYDEVHTFVGWFTEPVGGMMIENEAHSVVTSDMTLYAHWRSPDYRVQYEANGADGKMSDQARTYGDRKKLDACTFVKRGHTFSHWNTEQDDNGESYDDGYEGDLTNKDGAVVKLYAQWDAYQYTVHFDANGGDGSMFDQPRYCGDKQYLSANEFYKDNYEFSEWNTEKDGSGRSFADRTTEDITDENGINITLYAQWKEKPKYTISFDPGRGTLRTGIGMMKDQERHVGDGEPLPMCLYAPPAHSNGSVFTGWNTKADGSGEHFDDRSTKDVATSGKVTLYAQWSDSRFVVFNLNGHGDKAPAPQMRGQMHEYKLIKPDTEPAEAGYKFTGWYRSEECKPDEKWDFDNDSLTKPITTLYAGWEPVAYTVKFDANAPDDTTDVDGSMDNQERLFDDGKALPKVAYVLTDKDDSARSFVFSGWNTSADGSGDAFGDQDSQNITDAEGEVTLYAMWNIAQITTSRLPRGTQGEDYSYTLSYAGLLEGSAVKWSIIEGALPDGLSLDPKTGEISGNSDQAGKFEFTVKLTGTNLMGDLESLSKALSITLRQIDPEPLVIQFVEVMDGLWEKGNKTDLSFKTNGPFEMFEGVDVDGTELEEGRDYTAEEGSTIIKLKPSYLESLSDGSHILTAHYNDGQEPFTQFTVASKPDDDDKDDDKDNPKPGPDNDDMNRDDDKNHEEVNPTPDNNDNDASPDNGDGNGNGNKRRGANTGDDNHVAIWISLMLITASAIICLIMIRQRRRI